MQNFFNFQELSAREFYDSFSTIPPPLPSKYLNRGTEIFVENSCLFPIRLFFIFPFFLFHQPFLSSVLLLSISDLAVLSAHFRSSQTVRSLLQIPFLCISCLIYLFMSSRVLYSTWISSRILLHLRFTSAATHVEKQEEKERENLYNLKFQYDIHLITHLIAVWDTIVSNGRVIVCLYLQNK